MGLSGLTYQTAMQRRYLKVYSNVIQLHSTHMMTKYVLKASLPIGISCRGSNCSFGLQLLTSESQKHVFKGINELALNKNSSTLMSDGPKCFGNAAKEFDMRQLHCLKSFRGQKMEASAGMKSDQALLLSMKLRDYCRMFSCLLKRWKMLLMSWKNNILEPA